jgi:hypothetical protein
MACWKEIRRDDEGVLEWVYLEIPPWKSIFVHLNASQ